MKKKYTFLFLFLFFVFFLIQCGHYDPSLQNSSNIISNFSSNSSNIVVIGSSENYRAAMIVSPTGFQGILSNNIFETQDPSLFNSSQTLTGQ